MRRVLGLFGVLCAVVVAPALAQQDESQGPLRQRLEERFAQQVKLQLGLTDEQAVKLRETSAIWASRRRALEVDERGLKQALQGQLRPGVAANQDSVAKLTQKLLDLKVTYAQTYRDELKDWTFLSPVQRAQYLVIRERVFQALRDARQDRLGRRGAGPGAPISE